jgi:hypothetical protein
MKKLLIKLAGIIALTSALIVPNLGAVPVDLTTASSSYVGSITPNVPANPDDEEDYINFLRTLGTGTTSLAANNAYDQTFVRSGNALPGLPEADFSSKSDNDNTDFSLIDFTGYVLGKYDAENAGAWVWYLSDFTGDITVPSDFGGQYGLSHTSFFGGTPTNVPDGGTTAVLLGLGLVALSLINRRRSIA